MSCGRSAFARPFSNMNSAMRVAVVTTPGMQDGRYGRGLARQYHPASAPGQVPDRRYIRRPGRPHEAKRREFGALWRVDQRCREVLVRDLLRQGFCGDDEHLLRHAGRFSRKNRIITNESEVDIFRLRWFAAPDLTLARPKAPANRGASPLMGGSGSARP